MSNFKCMMIIIGNHVLKLSWYLAIACLITFSASLALLARSNSAPITSADTIASTPAFNLFEPLVSNRTSVGNVVTRRPNVSRPVLKG